MPLVVEDIPVVERTIVDEAADLLRTLKVGQSFVVRQEHANAVQSRAARIPGARFKQRKEGDQVRFGRVA